MKSSVSFVITGFSLFSLLILAIIGNIPGWVWFIPVGVSMVSTFFIYQGIYMPRRAVVHGINLIRSQDYNNRLVKVGEPNADNIIVLFNSLIDKLRAERLQNREQESLLKLLIEASPMGVVMLDFNNRISMTNLSFRKIFNIGPGEDIQGKKLCEIDNELISGILSVPLGKSEIIRRGNFRIFRCYHLSFVQEGFKREFYLLESLKDEIMKAERAAYEKLIRTISHEVNNTMGGVRSVLEIVGENTPDPDLKKVVESCERRCESMGVFIREYAEVVKLPKPLLRPVDLKEELRNMLPFLRKMAPVNIKLNYNDTEGPAIINADSALLQQVILNIVKNAIESINDEGVVEFEIRKASGAVILIISDNGNPIAEEVASQLFTPFFTTKPEGKGIGLTLSREILSHHEAEFSLSTGPDGITRFVVSFKEGSIPDIC